MEYYKIVTTNLQSLGLRKNPNIMTFEEGKWMDEPKPKEGKSDYGGIWVANGRGQANSLRRYMTIKGIPTRMFRVQIGTVLFSNSYRIKTDKVRLWYEIF